MPDTFRLMASKICFVEICVESSTRPAVCSQSFTKLCALTCRPVDPFDLTGQIYYVWSFARFILFFHG